MDKQIEYSYVLYADSEEIERKKGFLHRLVKQGIKVLIFTNKCIDWNIPIEETQAFKKARLFNIMISDCPITTSIEILDGRCLEGLKEIERVFPEFNVKQFIIEHAPCKENIMVKAGAGTGKTTVMIDRVIYLMIKERVKPSEIVMITFTRDAAQSMSKKLRELLILRFRATNSKIFLNILEELNEMNIKTIHSFSKNLLLDMGSLRGFGLNMKLRSFKAEKKKWIEEELDSYFKEELAEKNGTIEIESIISPLKFYELVDTLYDFWEKFEQKGFSSYEITDKADFGDASPGNEILNDLIQRIIRNVEERFGKEKETLNAVMMNDLTRQIDLITEKYGVTAFNNISTKISHMFVDEFQDSDDVQIRLIATIQEAFKSSLFVVGDTKQSIYRFRGANHTAFEILKQILNQRDIRINDQDYFLNRNYRTTQELLKEMDSFFTWWGEKGFLQYDGDSNRLKGVRHSNEELPLIIEKKREDTKHNMETTIMPFLTERFRQIKKNNESSNEGNEPDTLAILTRTIDEARLINKWCENSNLPTKLKVGGGFFISRPVRNFYSLILALLYPNNGKHVANLLEGPYGQGDRYLLNEIVKEGGFSGGTIRLMKETTDFPFNDYQNRLSYQPVLAVIRSIIQERRPYDWVFSRKLDDLKASFGDEYPQENLVNEAKAYTREYELNIGKMFEMLHQRFSQDFVSLYQIANWLQIEIATNRDEEKISYEGVRGGVDHIHILTAHRAKGLEYHTVIIPFTERPFTTSFSKIIFDDEKKRVGWSINKQGHEMRQNENFITLTSHDDTESTKEETRLLYVAMTRAKNQLVIIRNLKNDTFDWTWSKLLTQYR
ncbi:Superfamily I DNA or RNA helicase [Bacillus sp. OV194]|nr:Superfamily I DNA or RNA helicase [Bacillus sp. OV194]